MLYIRLLLVVNVLYTQTDGQTYTSVNKLKQLLLQNYLATTRPVINQTNIITVTVGVIFRSVTDFDIVEGVLTTEHVFYIKWEDELITWNPKQHEHIKEINLPFDDVWTPTISISNAIENYDLMEKYRHVLNVKFDYNGRAFIRFPTFIKSTCLADVKYFPFDLQNCHILFTQMGYDTASVILASGGMDTSSQIPNSQWDIYAADLRETTLDGKGSYLDFSVTLNRLSVFLIFNIFVPVFFLLFINFFVFVLPADCGEKVSFCTTIVLSLAIYMTIIMDQLPPVSKTFPLVSLFLCINLANNMGMCIAAIFSVHFQHQSDLQKIPRILHLVSTIVNRTNYRNPNAVTEGEIIKLDTDECGMDIISNRSDLKDCVESKQRPALTWTIVSKSIDKLTFIICVVITILEMILAWYYMSQQP